MTDSNRRLSILLVEPDPLERQIFVEALNQRPLFDVVTTSSRVEAAGVLQSRPVELLVLDPADAPPDELLASLRQGPHAELPTILLTDRTEHPQAAATMTMPKPRHPSDRARLVRCIQSFWLRCQGLFEPR